MEEGGNRKRGAFWIKTLRGREKPQRGGRSRQIRFPFSELSSYLEAYLENLAARNYSVGTLKGRGYALARFFEWCEERGLEKPGQITRPILEAYRRWLHRFRKKNGQPLGFSAQANSLTALREYFRWLCREDVLLHNPASELESPLREQRLPAPPLTAAEVETVLGQADLTDPLGLRDRAMLEVFYGSGIRRSELARLRLDDLDHASTILRIRQGKGRKDRYVPMGERALEWTQRYLRDVRPMLASEPHEAAVFLTSYGEAFNPDVLSRLVGRYIRQAETGKKGSCHLLRHSCATLMLENGADIRHIQQQLGHSELTATQIYTYVATRQLREVHARTHPAGLKRAGKRDEESGFDELTADKPGG